MAETARYFAFPATGPEENNDAVHDVRRATAPSRSGFAYRPAWMPARLNRFT